MYIDSTSIGVELKVGSVRPHIHNGWGQLGLYLGCVINKLGNHTKATPSHCCIFRMKIFLKASLASTANLLWR